MANTVKIKKRAKKIRVSLRTDEEEVNTKVVAKIPKNTTISLRKS